MKELRYILLRSTVWVVGLVNINYICYRYWWVCSPRKDWTVSFRNGVCEHWGQLWMCVLASWSLPNWWVQLRSTISCDPAHGIDPDCLSLQKIAIMVVSPTQMVGSGLPPMMDAQCVIARYEIFIKSQNNCTQRSHWWWKFLRRCNYPRNARYLTDLSLFCGSLMMCKTLVLWGFSSEERCSVWP